MKINRHLHQTLYYKNLLFTVLILTVLVACAWLSKHYHLQIDLTANASNTLSPKSIKVLEQLPEPVNIKVIIHEPHLRQQIKKLLSRYQQHKNNIHIEFHDPQTALALTKQYGIGQNGAVIVEYQNRHEKISYLDEPNLTSALLRLAGTGEYWLSFLTGHGERSLAGRANFDLGLFGTELEKRNIHAQSLNLAKIAAIPDNSSLLVLTEPGVDLLPQEISLIKDYIAAGGNLLLLTDPDKSHLQTLETLLGINKLPGMLMNSTANLYGIDDPGFILCSDYPPTLITEGFQNITVFPGVAALTMTEDSPFTPEPLLMSSKQSWTELGNADNRAEFDADSGEREGPLAFAYSLSRKQNHNDQRIVIIGDGDFLSNAYLNNVGNLELGLRIINWLIHQDKFINIPPKNTIGKTLQLSDFSLGLMGVFFLLLLPALFLLTGFIIWRRRKNA